MVDAITRTVQQPKWRKDASTIGGFRMGWGVLLACWTAAAAVALALGRDTSWDLRNYHYYNVYALLEGRWEVDLAPARAHSFLHPGLDLPFYLLTQSPLNTWPRLVSVLQASYAGLLAFLTIALANLACHGAVGRVTPASALVALFGLTGAATLPETGSTYNDVQIGCLVLGALLALLLAAEADDRHEAPQAVRRRLLAGFLGGCAVGLKLTAIIFPPALAVAGAIAVRGGVGSRTRAMGLLSLGGALGFAITYGPWGWFLWQRFGNPFGPIANTIFRSPLFPATGQQDVSFLPDSLAEALAYPLVWAHRSEGVVLEPPLADPRFAIGLAALVLSLVLVAWRRAQRDNDPRVAWVGAMATDPAERVAARAMRAVIAFVLVSYVAWLGVFAILRYAIPVEVLLGIPVWAAARELLVAAPMSQGSMPSAGWWRGGATLCLATALGVSALVTEYPAHPREPFLWEGEPHGTAVVAVNQIALPAGSLVVMLGPAVSFVAPFLEGPGVWFVGGPNSNWAGAATDPTSYAALVLRAVRSHSGPAFVVLEFPDDYDQEATDVLGIAFDRASCRPVENNLTRVVQICSWR
ncbi:hypothetical protein JMJ55_30225 [Belnapia sp. T6]|uniref:DUF2029 domain-containing protein n=1 Tax=Belnapia mucosa TaxID=2804532 RepID=A0ABS1VD04_9PROT|nr:glycosyltransferase 87 family protein [Belnapia mucosa]MBL6459585.1 hypothetical protein [Belnapia mucosa]